MNEIKFPENYFKLSDEDKKDVCVGLLETVYELLIKKQASTEYTKIDLMYSILTTTLEYNEQIEEYESCQVLLDARKLLDENRDN